MTQSQLVKKEDNELLRPGYTRISPLLRPSA